MAEQLLHHAQVGAALEQMRGEGVAQRMWRRALRQARPAHETVDAAAYAPCAQRPPLRVEEERVAATYQPPPRGPVVPRER